MLGNYTQKQTLALLALQFKGSTQTVRMQDIHIKYQSPEDFVGKQFDDLWEYMENITARESNVIDMEIIWKVVTSSSCYR